MRTARNSNYKELTGKVIMQHLTGAREDCSDVIGVYPICLMRLAISLYLILTIMMILRMGMITLIQMNF